MSFEIIFRSRANIQISQAYVYYEINQPNLGEKLFEVIAKYLTTLEKNPYAFPKEKSYFKLALKEFPYNMHYKIEGDEVIIFDFFHTSQNPTKKP